MKTGTYRFTTNPNEIINNRSILSKNRTWNYQIYCFEGSNLSCLFTTFWSLFFSFSELSRLNVTCTLCSSSAAHSRLTHCNPMDCNMPGFPVHHQLPQLAQTHVHRVNDAIHLILCCPLLLLPSIFSRIRVFSNESGLCIRWPKDWSFSFSISPSREYSGLSFFRIAVQGTLKRLLQHHSSKASVLRHSAFFIV